MEKFINRKIELAVEQLEEAINEINNEDFDNAAECFKWLDVQSEIEKAIFILKNAY